MQSPVVFALVALTILLGAPLDSEAYIGPGAGLAAIGTVIALIGGVLLAIVAFVWYPIKRLLAKVKKKKQGEDSAS